MHRILLLLLPHHLAPRCTPAADYEHGTLHCLSLHVVFTHHLHETSGNVFAISLEKKKNKLKVQNGWQRPAQQSC